jgi:hypothetical protein
MCRPMQMQFGVSIARNGLRVWDYEQSRIGFLFFSSSSLFVCFSHLPLDHVKIVQVIYYFFMECIAIEIMNMKYYMERCTSIICQPHRI